MILVALPAYVILLDGGDESGEDATELGFVLDIEEVVVIENTAESSCIWHRTPNPEFFLL